MQLFLRINVLKVNNMKISHEQQSRKGLKMYTNPTEVFVFISKYQNILHSEIQT